LAARWLATTPLTLPRTFLVSGRQEAGVVKRVVEGDIGLPAARALGENPDVRPMLDHPATSKLG
jgi:hypothetical protein